MKLEKPRVARVKLTAFDMDTSKSKSITVYDSDPVELIEFIEDALRKRDGAEAADSIGAHSPVDDPQTPVHSQ